MGLTVFWFWCLVLENRDVLVPCSKGEAFWVWGRRCFVFCTAFGWCPLEIPCSHGFCIGVRRFSCSWPRGHCYLLPYASCLLERNAAEDCLVTFELVPRIMWNREMFVHSIFFASKTVVTTHFSLTFKTLNWNLRSMIVSQNWEIKFLAGSIECSWVLESLSFHSEVWIFLAIFLFMIASNQVSLEIDRVWGP